MNQDSVQVEQQTSQPQAPAQPTISQSNNRNKFLIVSSALFVLLLAGAGAGYFVLSNKKTATVQYPKSITEKMIKITPISDPTDAWKTYTEAIFTFKYPSSWQVKDYPLQTPKSAEVYNPESGKDDGFGEGGKFYQEKVPFVMYQSTKTVEQIINEAQKATESENLAPGESFKRKKIVLNGKNVDEYFDPFGQGTTGWYVIFSNGNQIVEFGPFEDDPEKDSIQKQILSTFSFSDKTQSADTSNWKIYTNQYYQLKYPEEFYKPHVPEKFYGNSISSVSFLSINDTNQENRYQDVFPFTISVAQNKNNLSLDAKRLFEQNPELSYDISFLTGKQSKEVTLGSIKAYQYDDISAGVSGYEREIRTIKGNNIYVITVEYSNGKPVEKYRELIDKILSTFKFTQ